jgi:hypothetical protein
MRIQSRPCLIDLIFTLRQWFITSHEGTELPRGIGSFRPSVPRCVVRGDVMRQKGSTQRMEHIAGNLR